MHGGKLHDEIECKLMPSGLLGVIPPCREARPDHPSGG